MSVDAQTTDQPVDVSQTPESAAPDQQVVGNAEPEQQQPEQAADPQDSPRKAVEDFAASVDLPAEYFAGFETIEQAKTAYRQHVDALARQGSTPPAAQPTPQPTPIPAVPAPQAPVTSQLDLKALGIDDPDEPAAKVAAYFQKQLDARDAKIAKFEQTFSGYEQQHVQQVQAQVDEIVDGFASPMFGSGRAQNQIQARNRQDLLNLAANITTAYQNTPGQRMPSIKARLAMAKDIYDRQYAEAYGAPTPAPAVPQPDAAALPSRGTSGARPDNSGGYNSRWADQILGG